jgi:hypothetical protein
MKSIRVILATMICASCLAGIVGAAEEAEDVRAVQQDPCCFENPRYTGTCQVTPGPDESCADILAYLNNPNSVGKAYCGNTKVRGGWAQVDCDGSASIAIEEACNQNRD